jgi:Predicted membrane protein (DUF2207) C-terminal domain/Predicted membrane protein (DUF2207) N-terminal domain
VRTRSRRRLDLALLGGGSLLLGVGAAIGAFVGNPEHIQDMWAGASFHQDGSAAISEVIDWDFGTATDKHGIFRDVPGLDPAANIVVSSPDAPDDLLVTDAGGLTNLRIGSPSETVSGRHRYQISYDLGANVLAQNGRLAWNAIGAYWPVPMTKATVEAVAPFEFTDVNCFQGAQGSRDPCTITQPEPGHLVAQIGELGSNEGVTIAATPGAPLAAAPVLSPPTGPIPPGDGIGLVPPALVALFGALLGAFPASHIVRRWGRERVGAGSATDAAFAADSTSERRVDSEELASLATIEFAPPDGLSPAQGGVLLAESVEQRHKVAWFVTEAIDGAISLDEEDGKRVRMRRLDFGDPDASRILDTMFDGQQELLLGKYDKDFAAGWRQVGTGLQHWMETSGMWDPAGDRRRTTVRALGILVGVVGAGATVLSAGLAARYGAGWLAGVAIGAILAGIGWAGAIRAWELKVRTPLGSGLWLRTESFRRFLAQSEGYHAEQAAARGVLREYTAWAVSVGEVDRWTRAMASASNIPDQSALQYAYLYPLLFASTNAASTPPSSRGGGGGGGFGGSVGGGGGGGGGGSW